MRPHFALAALTAIALSGCTNQGPVPDEANVEPPIPSASPVEESFELGAVAPLVMLIIKANARTADGAVLELEQRVNEAVPLGDLAAQTVPALAIESCPGVLDSGLAAQGQWTFTRVVFSAISPDTSPAWPDRAPVSIKPSTEFAPIASMSFLQDEPGAPLPCEQEKFIGGPGKGAISIGSANDALDIAAGGYQRWSELNYGFVTLGTDITLTDCTFELTPLGAERGGGSSSWASINDSQSCVIGAQSPISQF